MVKMEPIFEVGGINIMKTIEEAASKINAKRANQSKYDISDAFRDGVEFAQEWISIDEELPEYYSSVNGIFIINDIEMTLSVWRAWSEIHGDIYTITGTDMIANGEPIKWRPINRK